MLPTPLQLNRERFRQEKSLEYGCLSQEPTIRLTPVSHYYLFLNLNTLSHLTLMITNPSIWRVLHQIMSRLFSATNLPTLHMLRFTYSRQRIQRNIILSLPATSNSHQRGLRTYYSAKILRKQ